MNLVRSVITGKISDLGLDVLTSLSHQGLGLRFPCNDLTLG